MGKPRLDSFQDQSRAARRSPHAAQIRAAIFQGLVLLAFVFAWYAWLLDGEAPPVARCAAFVTLVVAQLSLALSESMTSDSPLFHRSRMAFAAIAAVASGMLVAATTLAPLMGILRFSTPPAPTVTAAVLLGLIAGGSFGLLARARPQAPVRAEPAAH